MKKIKLTRSIIFIIILVFLVSGVALAATLYEVNWWDVSGGGGTSSGGQYTLNGTIGQPDAGAMDGGPYRITGGFWGGAVGNPPSILYLPIVIGN